MQDIELAINLLKVAQCPTCDGSGTYTFSITEITHGCCGQPLPNGECCGNAIPVEIPSEELVQCEWCAEREELISKYDTL